MKFVKALFWIVVVLGAIGGVLYLTVLDVWRVPEDPVLSASLEPNARAGDVLVLGRGLDVERGHLVRCPDPRPENAGQFVVGRILGKSNEEVNITNEVVSVDGKRSPSPYGCEGTTMKDPQSDDDIELVCSTEDTGEKTFFAYRAKDRILSPFHQKVPGGHIFLVSDNRHMHDDSRDFGAIEATGCQHVLLRLWGKAGISDSKTRFSWIW